MKWTRVTFWIKLLFQQRKNWKAPWAKVINSGRRYGIRYSLGEIFKLIDYKLAF